AGDNPSANPVTKTERERPKEKVTQDVEVGAIYRSPYGLKGACDVASRAESLCRFRSASPGAFLSVGRPVLGPDAGFFLGTTGRPWLSGRQALIRLHGLQPHPALGLEKDQRR